MVELLRPNPMVSSSNEGVTFTFNWNWNPSLHRTQTMTTALYAESKIFQLRDVT